jgi:hypothetical protein
MRKIKLFEGFNDGITEQEIRGALVELQDVGYDVLITKTSYDFDTKQFISGLQRGSKNGYTISISADDEFFDIKNVSEPILELIDYLTEKYGDRFVYSIEYQDYTTEEHEIEDLEQFVKDNPLEDTTEVIMILRVNNEN